MIKIKFVSLGKVILGDVIYTIDDMQVDKFKILKIKPSSLIGICYVNSFVLNSDKHILKSECATESFETEVKILSVSKVKPKITKEKMPKKKVMFQLGKVAKKMFNKIQYFKIRGGSR